MTWITIKDAAKLTNKSEISIKRLLYRIDKSKIHSSITYKKEPANHGFIWLIDQDSIMQYYKVNDPLKDTLKYQEPVSDISNDLIDILQSQLKEKDSQIAELNHRMSELTILLQQSLNQKLLPAPPSGLITRIIKRFL